MHGMKMINIKTTSILLQQAFVLFKQKIKIHAKHLLRTSSDSLRAAIEFLILFFKERKKMFYQPATLSWAGTRNAQRMRHDHVLLQKKRWLSPYLHEGSHLVSPSPQRCPCEEQHVHHGPSLVPLLWCQGVGSIKKTKKAVRGFRVVEIPQQIMFWSTNEISGYRSGEFTAELSHTIICNMKPLDWPGLV